MGKVNDKTQAAVVFFWSNGIRFVAFPAAMTYFKTRDADHYSAIVQIYNDYGVPFYEEPNNRSIDSRIFGVEIKDIWEDTIVKPSTAKVPESIKRTLVAINELFYEQVGPGIQELKKSVADLVTKIDTIGVAEVKEG